MHQNEEKIEKYRLIALMALIGIYNKYLFDKNKDFLCEYMHILIDFCNDNDLLKKEDLLLISINKVIIAEDLIKWQKERRINE